MILALAVLCLPAQGAAARAADAPFILRADRLLTGSGPAIENGALLIRGGRILQAGAEVVRPEGVVETRLAGTLAPGFFDAMSVLGAQGPLAEASRLSTPALLAADGFDPEAPVWAERLRQGVTAVQLSPEPRRRQGVPGLAGWGAWVRTGGADRLAALRTRQALSLLRYAPTKDARGATSLEGALEDLRPRLAAGVPGLKERGMLVFVDTAEAVDAARAMAREHGFEIAGWVAYGDPGIYGGALGQDLVALDAGAPLTPRTLETWKRLHAAGARLAFYSAESPAPVRLRTAAMALARVTGDAEAALAAVTSRPAALAGIPRAGRLVPGAPADLVLWSRHPLDSSARAEAVMIAGVTVYTAPAREDP